MIIENERLAAMNNRLCSLRAYNFGNSEDLLSQIAVKEMIAIDDSWQEFVGEAAKAKDEVLRNLRESLQIRRQKEVGWSILVALSELEFKFRELSPHNVLDAIKAGEIPNLKIIY